MAKQKPLGGETVVTEQVAHLSFEEALRELEQIVQQLEEGNLPLDQALALYERGVALAEHCQALLDKAELRIKQLVPNPEGGYDLEDFTGPLDSR